MISNPYGFSAVRDHFPVGRDFVTGQNILIFLFDTLTSLHTIEEARFKMVLQPF